MTIEIRTTTIAASSTNSLEIDTNGTIIVGIYIPIDMQSTTVSFLAGHETGQVVSRVNDGNGNGYSKSFTAGDYVPLDPSIFAGAKRIIVVSGSTESALRHISIAVRA